MLSFVKANKIDGEVRFGYLGEIYAAYEPVVGQDGSALDGRRSRASKAGNERMLCVAVSRVSQVSISNSVASIECVQYSCHR